MKFTQQTIKCVKHFATNPILRAVNWPKPNYGPLALMRSELMNGIKITAAQTSGVLIAACTIMFQAGSRCETHDDLGATHFLRTASTGSGCRATAFSKLRILQQNGSYLTTTSDRQTIAYTLRCPLPLFNDLKYYLLDTAASCCYHEWEISDRKPIVRGDLNRITPEQRVMDLIQKAAWAGPLANSVFCEDERIDSMSGEKLRSYAKLNLQPLLCTVASIGVPFEETMKIAEKISTNTEKQTSLQQPQSYPRAGYEYYDLGSGSDTWIAVAVPGCGSCDLQNLLKHVIVASACGTDNLQMGTNGLNHISQSPLGLMCGNDIFTDYRAFNISYADTGLFGILAKTQSASACRTATAVAEFLANVGELDFTQIEEGKKRLQLSLAIHNEDCMKICEGLALQTAYNIQLECIDESINMIRSICPDEITATAKSLSSNCNKMAIAIVGDIGVVPIDQEIFKRF